MGVEFNRHNLQTNFIYTYDADSQSSSRFDFLKRVPKTLYFGAANSCKQSCLFCHSKDLRHKGQNLCWDDYIKCLDSFKKLPIDYEFCCLAGGGEPMLYRDSGKTVNDQILAAHERGYKVYLISAENDYSTISKDAAAALFNLRISFTRINEKNNTAGIEYNFGHIAEEKIKGSYIMYDDTLPKYDADVEQYQRARNTREWLYHDKTTNEIIDKIILIHQKYSFLDQTRISPDYFLNVDDAEKLVKRFKYRLLKNNFNLDRFEIDTSHARQSRFTPYRESCIEGLLNPTVHPKYADGDANDDGSFIVSWCRQHVFNKKTFDDRYFTCRIDDILETFNKTIENYIQTGAPHLEAPSICTMCCASKMQEAAHKKYNQLKK